MPLIGRGLRLPPSNSLAADLPPVPSPIITDPQALEQLCERLSAADIIGIDTEFVSEDTFHPQLCLVQVATADELAAIDPLALPDLIPFGK